MSKGVNKVILIGNLGQDPEAKYLPNGGAVTNVTVATSESWKDKNTGEQKEKKAFQEQVLKCLEDDDAHGLAELWSEYDTDHKAVLWGLFNSQQRSAMKRLEKGE